MLIHLNRLPELQVPNAFFVEMLLDSLVLAIVGYCVSLSMAKLFSTKFDYPMDGNQEMLSEVTINQFFICFYHSFSLIVFLGPRQYCWFFLLMYSLFCFNGKKPGSSECWWKNTIGLNHIWGCPNFGSSLHWPFI